MLRPVLSIMVLLACPASAAAGKFDLSASVRARGEAIAGQSRTGFRTDDAVLALRSAVLGTWRSGAVEVGAELYDSRVYGDRRRSAIGTTDVNTIELVQAYAAIGFGTPAKAGSGGRIAAGRMLLDLGSRRLVANDDYRNTVNGFTGLRGEFHWAGGARLVAAYVLPQRRLPDDPDSLRRNEVGRDREDLDTRLLASNLELPVGAYGTSLDLGYYALVEHDGHGRPTRDRRLHTVTARLLRPPKAGRLDLELEGMIQTGRISRSFAQDATRQPVRASFVHAEIGWTMSGAARLRAALEYDRASGDRRGGHFGRFDTLYGMRRADLAPAGIFNAIGRTNVEARGLRLEAEPSARLDGFVSWRHLRLAAAGDAFSNTGVIDSAGASGRSAGGLFDGRVRWWMQPKRLRLELTGTWLAKGRFLKTAPNASRGDDTRYGALAITRFF